MGWYTAQNNDKVNKLVLYAPQWLRNVPALTDTSGKLGAYRTVSREAARARWLTGVAESKKAELIPPGWFEAWADATFATDPVGSRQTPQVLRAPNGVVQDGREFWAAGKPLYHPAGIRVPTFLAHAEWDADLPSYMLHAYFARLTGAPYKRYVEIGEGTHTFMMEKNRMQLFEAVQQFLDERIHPGQKQRSRALARDAAALNGSGIREAPLAALPARPSYLAAGSAGGAAAPGGA